MPPSPSLGVAISCHTESLRWARLHYSCFERQHLAGLATGIKCIPRDTNNLKAYDAKPFVAYGGQVGGCGVSSKFLAMDAQLTGFKAFDLGYISIQAIGFKNSPAYDLGCPKLEAEHGESILGASVRVLLVWG